MQHNLQQEQAVMDLLVMLNNFQSSNRLRWCGLTGAGEWREELFYPTPGATVNVPNLFFKLSSSQDRRTYMAAHILNFDVGTQVLKGIFLMSRHRHTPKWKLVPLF